MRVLTIETWLQGIGLRRPIEEFPAWPPDLYALAGTLLRRSGAYLRVFERLGSRGFLDDISAQAADWRRRIDDITSATVTVSEVRTAGVSAAKSAWTELLSAKLTPVSQIRSSQELTEILIRLALLDDEASAKAQLRPPSPPSSIGLSSVPVSRPVPSTRSYSQSLQ